MKKKKNFPFSSLFFPVLGSLGLLLFAGASGGKGRNPSLSETESLVQRLRELKLQKKLEKEAWEREKEDLLRLIEIRSEELNDLKEIVEREKKKNDLMEKEVKAKRNELYVLRAKAEDLEALLRGYVDFLEHYFHQNPLVLDSKQKKTWAIRRRSASSLGDRISWLLEFLLSVIRRGVEAKVERREIQLEGGESLVAEVLRLGAYGLFFMSLDGKICGTARPLGGRIVWKKLDKKYRRSVRRCIEAVQRKIPACFEVLPLFIKKGA